VNSKPGKLFLIPVFLAETTPDRVFPSYNIEVLKQLRYFIAEHQKNARRFIKKVAPEVPQSGLHFFELNKHTDVGEISSFLKPLLEGKDMGLLSDSGMPAVADPGAKIVRAAHKHGIEVIPLVGPSSVLLALAASGLNGQHFEFHGYLPIDKAGLAGKLKSLVKETQQSGKTQIFIETPYRNKRIFDILLRRLPGHFLLCVATNLTHPNQFIQTKSVSEWKRQKMDWKKIPAIFLFGI
jgi:16S rRNA (cytidine1402-2'-O)-methyltransferase